MLTTKDLLQTYEVKTVISHRSERGDLISFFREKINAGRVGTKYKMFTIQSMGNLLSIYSIESLYLLRNKCESSKNFCATFWWHFKKPAAK